MHDADAKKFSAETISQAVASWFAHQVLRPHIGLSAGSSTLLRKGVGSGLAQASAGKAALDNLPVDDPEPSDSGTEDTWPEAEESANLNDHYVDAQLISLLGIQDSFIAPHVQVPIISPHVRAPSIQDFSNEAPAPPRPPPATGWGRAGRDIESCRRPRVRAGNPACGSEAGLDRIAVYLGRPGSGGRQVRQSTSARRARGDGSTHRSCRRPRVNELDSASGSEAGFGSDGTPPGGCR